MSDYAQECLRRSLAAPVYDVVTRTPLDEAPRLSARIGARLLLKREDLQPTFSFKLRGAYNRIQQMTPEQRALGVIAASAGNHAQGVAMAARELGVAATIFMPRTTPEIKLRAVAALGATIELHGDDYDTACEAALLAASKSHAQFIHPFDDLDVIAGQGTLGIEIVQQLAAAPGVIFVPIGGGGLAAGVVATVKTIYPMTRVIGVEPDDAASMKAALAAGRPVDIGATGIFADGVAVRQVGETSFKICQQLLDEVITVNVDQICAAVRSIFEEVRVVVEPAGALAVAGALAYARRSDSAKDKELDWVAIVSGANINFDRIGHVVERCSLGDGSEALLSVQIPERPGSFLEFCNALGGSSITEFNYRYNGSNEAHVFVGVRLQEAAEGLRQRLIKQGYDLTDLSGNELAKLHLRHLVGGCLPSSEREKLYRFEFPQRPGALQEFLAELAGRWSISLFHYRNHGSAHARVLAGFLVPLADDQDFHDFLVNTGYRFFDETDNAAFISFLGAPQALRGVDADDESALNGVAGQAG